jgi:hypothetical protein
MAVMRRNLPGQWKPTSLMERVEQTMPDVALHGMKRLFRPETYTAVRRPLLNPRPCRRIATPRPSSTSASADHLHEGVDFIGRGDRIPNADYFTIEFAGVPSSWCAAAAATSRATAAAIAARCWGRGQLPRLPAYHSWTYDIDGADRGAADGPDQGFDPRNGISRRSGWKLRRDSCS